MLTGTAILAHPTFNADLVAELVAHIVPEVVVPWSALLVALAAVVVVITANADAVLKVGDGPVVLDGLAPIARVDHAFTDAPLNQQVLACMPRDKNTFRMEMFICKLGHCRSTPRPLF